DREAEAAFRGGRAGQHAAQRIQRQPVGQVTDVLERVRRKAAAGADDRVVWRADRAVRKTRRRDRDDRGRHVQAVSAAARRAVRTLARRARAARGGQVRAVGAAARRAERVGGEEVDREAAVAGRRAAERAVGRRVRPGGGVSIVNVYGAVPPLAENTTL